METLLGLLQQLVLSFIPLFVAIDALGTLPIILSLTHRMKPATRSRVMRLAILTALGLGLGFAALGKGVFLAIGVQVADFMVAGGIILFMLAARDLLRERLGYQRGAPEDDLVGVVPIGTPLVVGPATLTTLLLLIDRYSLWLVILAFVLNLVFAWLVFSQANRISAFLGRGGLGALSKVSSLLLAAIAVKLIREGISQTFGI